MAQGMPREIISTFTDDELRWVAGQMGIYDSRSIELFVLDYRVRREQYNTAVKVCQDALAELERK